MATLIGKVGMVMKGNWSSSATYEVLDAVTYQGSLYIAKQAVPANTAPTNTTYWQVGMANTVETVSGYSLVDNYITTISSFIVKRSGKLVTLTFSGSIAAIPYGTRAHFLKDLPKAESLAFGFFFTNVTNPAYIPVKIDSNGDLSSTSDNGYSNGFYSGTLVYFTSE